MVQHYEIDGFYPRPDQNSDNSATTNHERHGPIRGLLDDVTGPPGMKIVLLVEGHTELNDLLALARS